MDWRAWGVDEGWWDVHGRYHDAPAETIDAIGRALGVAEVEAEDPGAPPEGPPLWFVRPGQAHPLNDPCELTIEEGSSLGTVRALPADLPPGYHRLRPVDGGPVTTLICSPGHCHLPPAMRIWGWAVQLYAARSRASWGMGDLADLRDIRRWAGAQGAGVLAVNPLHAAGPSLPQQPSPYFPSSRRWRSPLYLRVEDVPGADGLGEELQSAAMAGRALNEERIIDRDQVWALKEPVLAACFERAGDADDFVAWRRRMGDELTEFAIWCAIAEEHGNGWMSWPAELRHPWSPEVARFAEAHAGRVTFYAWLQWCIDQQLSEAGVPLLQDLAIGFDAGGADGWAWQDLLALDMRVGAPPDDFNPDGQDWGLPPFVPWKLRAAGYQPLISTLRAAFSRAGGLRIDHVMGLFRLFWMPLGGGGPATGTYVRYPARELLDIVALESARAEAFVVGEDLGTVEEGVRDELADRNVLSYRLLWFEDAPPAAWPEQALAAVTTHDLPTIAGVWSGEDLDHQRTAGLAASAEANDQLRSRLVATAEGDRAAGGDGDRAPAEPAHMDSWSLALAAHRALSGSPARVVLGTFEDALGVTERPNMPGTVDNWPNWRLALPVPAEDLPGHPGVHALGEALGSGR